MLLGVLVVEDINKSPPPLPPSASPPELNVVVVKDKVRSIIELPKKEKKEEEGLPLHPTPPKAIMNKNCLDENKQTSK